MFDLRRLVSITAALPLALQMGVARADDPKAATPPPRPMPVEEARERTFAWAATAAGTERPPEAVTRLWQNAEAGIPARGVHDLVVRSFAAVDPAVAGLFASFDLRNPPLVAPQTEEVLNKAGEGFHRTNLALHLARLLTDARMFDEALELYEAVDPAQAVDPVTALFYQAVCEHQLLMKEEGLKTLARLDAAEPLPESYASVARLMRAELEALEEDSLDEIAGLMRDVGRRLELARGGQRVQKKEDEITSKLDQMIGKIEQQMSQSGGGGGGGSNQGSNPLQDSVVKGQTAPGEVDPKAVRKEGGWGDLSPREREQVKSDIEKSLPAGYWRLINEYTVNRARVDRPDSE